VIRAFISFGSIAAALFFLTAGAEPGRLEIPANHSIVGTSPTGLQRLHEGLGLFYVPQSYHPNEPLPLLILLHGGDGDPSGWFGSYSRRAETEHFIAVAPKATTKTWGSSGDFGADIARINRALVLMFERYAIAPDRIAVAGVSDGASYALSLGLANGDRVRGVIAFSPGYIVGRLGRGRASFFISHGTRDPVLPIGQTRVFINFLRQAGYPVEYHEFNGVHEVPPGMSDTAMKWLAGVFGKKR
jgi:predicted esterase